MMMVYLPFFICMMALFSMALHAVDSSDKGIVVRKSNERGHADHGWLNTYYTFSFSDYYDPNFMGFRQLRVINEDRVAPKKGFPTHSHKDMEILTILLEGQLAHKDSMNNVVQMDPGEVQIMSAGSGITHSEYNASDKGPVHLLQIWIMPNKKNLPPRYEQTVFLAHPTKNQWTTIVSPDRRQRSLLINQDVVVQHASIDKDASLSQQINPGRYAWLQMIKGSISLNGVILETGDGAAISKSGNFTIQALEPSELVWFDLN